MPIKDTIFDYKNQRILVDLDFSIAPYLGDQIVGYYRLGIVRALFPNSHITVKINKILYNFYFEEADETIYDFNSTNFRDFDIFYRHVYNIGAKRCFFSSYDYGLDYTIQKDPNDRDYTKNFKIHPDIFKYLPTLKLRNYKEVEQKVKEILLKNYSYKHIVYLAFREGLFNKKERNFSDNILEPLILELSRNFKNTLFIMHTYNKKWAYFFLLNNVFNVLTFSELSKQDLFNINLHNDAFETGGSTKADINLEIIAYLISKSDLFITSGNTGLGCFAQFLNPNMLCFVALKEINWITKDNKYYACLRKEEYSEFTKEEISNSCVASIQKCNK